VPATKTCGFGDLTSLIFMLYTATSLQPGIPPPRNHWIRGCDGRTARCLVTVSRTVSRRILKIPKYHNSLRRSWQSNFQYFVLSIVLRLQYCILCVLRVSGPLSKMNKVTCVHVLLDVIFRVRKETAPQPVGLIEEEISVLLLSCQDNVVGLVAERSWF
jgi:hypothetical protein